jgi:very-short-patch-repair endonuclease
VSPVALTPDVGAYFGRCLARCESPIERMFLACLVFWGDYTFSPFDHTPVIARDGMGLELGQQVTCGDFRIDFTLVRPGHEPRLAIELDGYAYHGSTPMQFARDCSRRRALIAQGGWQVLPFSGREVTENARRCAIEAMRAAAKLFDRETPQREDLDELPGLQISLKQSTDWAVKLELAKRIDAIQHERKKASGT